MANQGPKRLTYTLDQLRAIGQKPICKTKPDNANIPFEVLVNQVTEEAPKNAPPTRIKL